MYHPDIFLDDLTKKKAKPLRQIAGFGADKDENVQNMTQDACPFDCDVRLRALL
jgi:hypothetical protein